ncbi:MAG: ATP-binding protein [bacterium]|nr:ATP-binding protein [bacterium]
MTLPGGGALRTGLDYEDWWLAWRIVEMLEGKATRIRLEPPGDEGTGIEFEVDIKGETWGEQAKDEQKRWTINRLRREKVLSAAKTQIGLGRGFRFVATKDASELAALSSFSKKAESFAYYEQFLTDGRRADLAGVAEEWGISEADAWRMLKKVDVRHLTMDSLRMTVTTKLEHLYVDDPAAVVGALRLFCHETMHRSFTAPEVEGHFEKKGFRRRLIVGDQNVINRLRDTVQSQDLHVASSEPAIGLVTRSDVGCLLNRLRDPDCKQIVVVDGTAGSGKSTVITAVAKELQNDGWFVAVARMDGHSPISTSADLGQAMGLVDKPSVLLAGVSDGMPALLVVDQLDAASLYSGRMPNNFNAVQKTLAELEPYPHVKVLLVTRTADLRNDWRMVRLLKSQDRVEQHTIGKLDVQDVKTHLSAKGIGIPMSATTLELLRTPLHLAIFSHLPKSAQATNYSTLQGLYKKHTEHVRVGLERERGFDPASWGVITGTLVEHMSASEVLSAPKRILAEVSPVAVRDLVSESVLVDTGEGYAFFHESYFDFLFAQGFVASGRSLHGFLVESEQGLFRRAQVRQVLEYLSSEDRSNFRSTVVELLSSDHIRFHLKDAVVSVLSDSRPTAKDWEALNFIAWDGSSIGSRLITVLGQGGWFDAVDSLGLWEEWLADREKADKVFHQVMRVAKERPARVAALVRPHIGQSGEWRIRFHQLARFSLNKELVDPIVELVERGQLDDIRDPWSLFYSIKGYPAEEARLIGSFLQRGLAQALEAGLADPFSSGLLSRGSQSHSVISDVAAEEPAAFIRHVLPFVIGVSMSNQRRLGQESLPCSDLWTVRYRGQAYGLKAVVFKAITDALEKLAVDRPEDCATVIRGLRHAESEELRFLACRVLTVMNDSDDAMDWLLSDTRNFALGWSDNHLWASRELIEKHSVACSTALFERLEEFLLGYSLSVEKGWPKYRGRSRYELLSAMPFSRLSNLAKRKLQELERRFKESSLEPPRGIEVRSVESPIPEESTKHMSDDNWIRALKKHTSKQPTSDGHKAIGGAFHLAQQLGRRSKEHPERFAELSLRFDNAIPSVAMNTILDSVSDSIDSALLTNICEHAANTYGTDAAQSVCQAIWKTKAGNPTTVRIITSYSQARDEQGSEEYPSDTAREWAALAAASVLLSGPDHVDELLPVIETLANDHSLRVRCAAAFAVHVLGNHQSERALEIAETLFQTPEVLDSHNSENLLGYAVLWRPDRFVPLLSRALRYTGSGADPRGGGGSVARRAGCIWAVAYLRNRFPSSITHDVSTLPVAARVGAAQILAARLPDSLDVLPVLFDDDDPEVRRSASFAVRYIAEISANEQDELLEALVQSKAFSEGKGLLFIELRELPGELPNGTITACERAIELAGALVGDIRTAEAGLGTHLSDVVLRLYKESEDDLKIRCLNIIDKLVEFNAFAIQKRLDQERQ